MARHSVAAGLVSLALGCAIWSGCRGGAATGGTSGAAGHAPDGSGGTAGAGTDAEVGGAAGGPVTTDAGPPYPGAAACPNHPGWYASPNMPPSCFYTCIPDDVKARVPPLQWATRDDWCAGCKWLEPSWWPGAQPGKDRPVAPQVTALGAGPDLLELLMWLPDNSAMVAMYGQDGVPVLGVTGNNASASCALSAFALGQDGKTVGARYEKPRTNQRWMLRPEARASELMLATTPDFAYGTSLIGDNAISTAFSFTADWIADGFAGFMTLVDVKQQTAVKINALPGAPPGEYDDAVISGDAAFVMAFTDKSSWFVVTNGAAKPFLGGATVDIDRFATDGKWIVWNEGTQLVADPADPSRMIGQRYDLYRAPFTTDATKLQRQLLLANTRQFLGSTTFANGYYAGTMIAPLDGSGGIHTQAWVVQVDSGRAWISDLPDGYAWGPQNYPTATELWGGVEFGGYDSAYAYTIARVPYADMQQIQAAPP